jgi:hypothetical protein
MVAEIELDYLSRCPDRLRVGWPGFDFQQGQDISFLFKKFRRGLGLSVVYNKYRGCFSWCKADHSAESGARVKMMELYLHFPTCLEGVMLA